MHISSCNFSPVHTIFKTKHFIFIRIRNKGIDCRNVGIGATPTCSKPPEAKFVKGITEFHPGNYVFNGKKIKTFTRFFAINNIFKY